MNEYKEKLLSKLTAQEKKELFEDLKKEQDDEKLKQRQSYEKLRHDFATDIMEKVRKLAADSKAFKTYMDDNAMTFRDIMAEYGKLRKNDQSSFTIVDGKFKLEVRSNKVKQFDERADIAAEKLMIYLENYISQSDKGPDDPIYQLAMSLLERNSQGQLDYKSISKLYELEGKFGEEYGRIMDLFRESNIVMATAINYYFWIQDDKNIWHRIEPSFCRL
jgi:hypothetical protein